MGEGEGQERAREEPGHPGTPLLGSRGSRACLPGFGALRHRIFLSG
ncbi:hypothetical protein D187_002315 [Cystobacter fuscus DSM 2262]|uniref:Uncharacterized protein n=1 Tax=Cystobacter fuscus (strain ATCC 25194 / DSM 2262 / NBRC 100088 / M29) TaxID=1242864 RepID=S9QFZ6_CYSF2|nr:hypothetical protein D187_002315 [Cystobacter fuscus DSM 2262]